jgi:hypothetical protein
LCLLRFVTLTQATPEQWMPAAASHTTASKASGTAASKAVGTPGKAAGKAIVVISDGSSGSSSGHSSGRSSGHSSDVQ